MQIHESAEDYLETILMLEERGKPVRSIDIVNEMNYSKPSVSIAMKKLRESGYIRMSSSGQISLLPAGRKIAEEIWARHRLLTDILTAVGVEKGRRQNRPAALSMTSTAIRIRSCTTTTRYT